MILEGRDVRLNYFVTGKGAPVTLLHGFTQRSRSWDEVISKMPEGWLWIVPDLRGHGATETDPDAPCSMEACTADLEILWDHLGLERAHLAGYSMGGRLALHVAARRPERVRSLLTIGAHAGLEEEARASRRRADEALAERIENEGIDAFVSYWESLPLFSGLKSRGPDYLTQIRAERLRNQVAGLACSLRGMGSGAMEPVWEELAHVPFPCSFVAGELDAVFVTHAQRLGATVNNGKVAIVPDAGHPAHQERPDPFTLLFADHLEKAKTGTSSSSATSA